MLPFLYLEGIAEPVPKKVNCTPFQFSGTWSGLTACWWLLTRAILSINSLSSLKIREISTSFKRVRIESNSKPTFVAGDKVNFINGSAGVIRLGNPSVIVRPYLYSAVVYYRSEWAYCRLNTILEIFFDWDDLAWFAWSQWLWTCAAVNRLDRSPIYATMLY